MKKGPKRFVADKVKGAARKSLESILLLLSFFVKRNRGLVVFSMTRGRYRDNARILFEHMVDNPAAGIEVAWLADPALPEQKIPEKYKDRFVRRNSFRGFYLCSTADVVVLCHGLGDYGLLREIAKRRRVVMLWHAITTKYCGLLDSKFDDNRKVYYTKREANYYDILIASSDIDRYYSASYTGLDINSVRVTGLPRNDRLFRDGKETARQKGRFSLLYAPTFRDYAVEEGSLIFPFNTDAKEIADWAGSAGIRFLLRPHPNDCDSVNHVLRLNREHPDIFRDARVDNCPDVIDLVLSCDGIVTDYSSTYVDGLALDLPVVFVDYDRARYMEERGLAYDYDLITPGPKVKNWSEFQRACEEMLEGAEGWAEHREFVRKMFFKYRDANGCSRVTEIVQELVER